MATPPSGVSLRLGTQYFRIVKTGPCWDAIERNADVGVYAPKALPDAELELVVILETDGS